jgi:hypothetical protein
MIICMIATSGQMDHASTFNPRWNFNDVGGGVFAVDRCVSFSALWPSCGITAVTQTWLH